MNIPDPASRRSDRSANSLATARRRLAFSPGAIGFLSAILAFVAVAATPPGSKDAQTRPAPGSSLSNTVIYCVRGTTIQSTRAIFRGNVQVFDPQLYMECDWLTAYYPSNNTSGAGAANPKATVSSPDAPNVGRIDTIVAETNVLMMLKGATIIGDQAIYYATNDIVYVSGDLVAVETGNGYLFGTNLVYYRTSGMLKIDGPNLLETIPGTGLLERTNGPSSPKPRSGSR